MQTDPTTRRAFIARLLLLIFCFSMCAAMIAITAVRMAQGTAHGAERLIGNFALWLAPAVYALWRKQRTETALLWCYAVFVFLASFLGTVLGFYIKISWYDLATHFVSGYLLGFLGLFLMCKLADVRNLRAPFVIFVCFCFSVACAGLWEIFEFVTDILFDGIAQGIPVEVDGALIRAVNDTMEDMICGALGALVFIIHLIAHYLSKRSLLVGAFMEKYGTNKTKE